MQIDTIYSPTVDSYQALKDNPKVKVEPLTTAQVRVLRVRVDQDPWKDNKVRQALKLAQDCARHRCARRGHPVAPGGQAG